MLLSVVALALGVAGAGWAVAEKALSASQIVAGVQARYANIRDIQARFEQVTVLPGGRRLEAAGSAYFKKPNMIRWDFSRPEPQSVITDGKTMWLYEPQAKQVQVYDASMLDPRLRMGFFSDLRRLGEDFALSAGPPTECCYRLELEPRPGRGLDLRHLTLLISRQPMRVVEARILDAAGGETAVRFKDIKENSKLLDSLFKFTPPSGVRVIKPQATAPGY
jgi:outer membrane lipoprotein carrier protein